jgi:uncharacterized membrane protein HdeD (DUF308 family)
MAQRHQESDRHWNLIGGIIVLGVGLVFLLSNLRVIPDLVRMWPLLLVVVGVALLIGALLGRDKRDTHNEREIHNP